LSVTSESRPAVHADDAFPHVWVYLGFLTTAFQLPKEEYLVHRFAYVVYTVMFVYFALRRRLIANKQIVVGLLILLLISFISIGQGVAETPRVFRSFGGLLGLHMVLFSYFAYYDFDYRPLIRHYIIIALINAVVGIVQEISWVIHFDPGWDMSWLLFGMNTENTVDLSGGGPVMRVNGLYGEPGYLAARQAAAGFLAINHFVTGNRKFLSRGQSILILISQFLTFSSLGYCGIVLSLLFHIKSRQLRRALVPIAAIGLVLVAVASSVDFVKSRLEGLETFATEEVTGHEDPSSLVYAINFTIAVNSAVHRPIIGYGYDSYRLQAENSLDDLGLSLGFSGFIADQFDGNKLMFDDGATMYFRVTTEFGLVGVALVFLFFFMNRVTSGNSERSMLQKMCVIFCLTYSIRTGQYIRFELWYFIALYWCLKQVDLRALRAGERVSA